MIDLLKLEWQLYSVQHECGKLIFKVGRFIGGALAWKRITSPPVSQWGVGINGEVWWGGGLEKLWHDLIPKPG